jgi:hypothetical protein
MNWPRVAGVLKRPEVTPSNRKWDLQQSKRTARTDGSASAASTVKPSCLRSSMEDKELRFFGLFNRIGYEQRLRAWT